MSFNNVLEQIKKNANQIEPLGGILKISMDDQIIIMDGSGVENIIRTKDGEADTVIILSLDTYLKLKSGVMSSMMAMMIGKVKIKGDMSLINKLQLLLSRV